MKIGFIGLGQMGSGMAANLLKAGHELTVWNRSPEKTKDLVAAGATRADTPAEAAQGEVVMSMLAQDAAVEAVVFGADGILDAPALHVSHSTISVALAERLAQAQGGKGGFVSAPVFGRPDAAAAAKLFVLAAGEPARIERCRPLLDAIGQRVFEIGTEPSAANRVKLSGNFMIMTVIEAMAEAMSFAEAGGIGRGTLLEVLTNTLFDAPVYRNYGRMLVEQKFRPAGFAAPLGLKDMNLVDAAAGASQVPMPFLGVIRDRLRATIAHEGPEIDWAGIGLAVRRAAGQE